jgi:hypothetical protein
MSKETSKEKSEEKVKEIAVELEVEKPEVELPTTEVGVEE